MSDGPNVGYHTCVCRDCFELYVGEPCEFCDDCTEAGCEHGSDCRAPEAYGGAEEMPDERSPEDWKHHTE